MGGLGGSVPSDRRFQAAAGRVKAPPVRVSGSGPLATWGVTANYTEIEGVA